MMATPLAAAAAVGCPPTWRPAGFGLVTPLNQPADRPLDDKLEWPTLTPGLYSPTCRLDPAWLKPPTGGHTGDASACLWPPHSRDRESQSTRRSSTLVELCALDIWATQKGICMSPCVCPSRRPPVCRCRLRCRRSPQRCCCCSCCYSCSAHPQPSPKTLTSQQRRQAYVDIDADVDVDVVGLSRRKAGQFLPLLSPSTVATTANR